MRKEYIFNKRKNIKNVSNKTELTVPVQFKFSSTFNT